MTLRKQHGRVSEYMKIVGLFWKSYESNHVGFYDFFKLIIENHLIV